MQVMKMLTITIAKWLMAQDIKPGLSISKLIVIHGEMQQNQYQISSDMILLTG